MSNVDPDGVARPWCLLPSSRMLAVAGLVALLALGRAARAQDTNAEVEFLEPLSMLFQANQQSMVVDGSMDQWSGPYIAPQPEEALAAVPVLLTVYPRAVITAPNASVLRTLAEPELWDAIAGMGFRMMHPVAMLHAGGIRDREFTPSIDGGFDRIRLDVDPLLGSEEDMRALVDAATQRDAILAGDVIPLHTGLGADFWLATMNYEDYPGVYNMVEIPQEQWGLLPAVDDRWGYAVILKDQAGPLIENGLLPGTFDVSVEHPDSDTWSGWAATAEIPGVDGTTRRWAYAHVFKPAQPVLNWIDPSYGARAIQGGDMVRHVHDLGMRMNRLDAVPFLGLDPTEDGTLQVYMTELAITGTNDVAMISRRLGGWTFVELNVPTAQYKEFMQNGADLGYDFFTRAETVHPLITEDARLLRVAHRALLDAEVDHRTLIHDMQNHDEITYQLINLGAIPEVRLGDETLSGAEYKERVLEEMRTGVAGENAPYNRLYRPERDGVATTFAGFIAAALGIADPYAAAPEDVERIRRAHVLIAMATAMQPGVFGISTWDLVGALPVPEETVSDRTQDGDFRWINRGAVDLMGRSDATSSPDDLPEAPALYGPLPQQLEDPESFASQVADIIRARQEHRISEAEMVDVPDVEPQSVAVYVMRLPDDGGVAVTALNYGREQAEVTVDVSAAAGDGGVSGTPRDAVSGEEVGSVSGNQVTIPVSELAGRTVVIGR